MAFSGTAGRRAFQQLCSSGRDWTVIGGAETPRGRQRHGLYQSHATDRVSQAEDKIHPNETLQPSGCSTPVHSACLRGTGPPVGSRGARKKPGEGLGFAPWRVCKVPGDAWVIMNKAFGLSSWQLIRGQTLAHPHLQEEGIQDLMWLNYKHERWRWREDLFSKWAPNHLVTCEYCSPRSPHSGSPLPSGF